MTTGGTYPSLVITVTTPSTGAKQRFTIALIEIVEEDPNGNLVNSLDLTNVVFETDSMYDSLLQTWSFTANVSSYGPLSMYLKNNSQFLKSRVIDSG